MATTVLGENVVALVVTVTCSEPVVIGNAESKDPNFPFKEAHITPFAGRGWAFVP